MCRDNALLSGRADFFVCSVPRVASDYFRIAEFVLVAENFWLGGWLLCSVNSAICFISFSMCKLSAFVND